MPALAAGGRAAAEAVARDGGSSAASAAVPSEDTATAAAAAGADGTTATATAPFASPAVLPLWSALCKLLSHAGRGSDQVGADAPHAHGVAGRAAVSQGAPASAGGASSCAHGIFADLLQYMDQAAPAELVRGESLANALGVDAGAQMHVGEALDVLCERICRSEFLPRACVELPGTAASPTGPCPPPPGTPVLFPYCYAQEEECSFHSVFGLNSLRPPTSGDGGGAACYVSFQVSVARLLQLQNGKRQALTSSNWLALGSTQSPLLVTPPKAFLVFLDEIGEDTLARGGIKHVLDVVQPTIDLREAGVYTKWEPPPPATSPASGPSGCLRALAAVLCEVHDASGYVVYINTGAGVWLCYDAGGGEEGPDSGRSWQGVKDSILELKACPQLLAYREQ